MNANQSADFLRDDPLGLEHVPDLEPAAAKTSSGPGIVTKLGPEHGVPAFLDDAICWAGDPARIPAPDALRRQLAKALIFAVPETISSMEEAARRISDDRARRTNQTCLDALKRELLYLQPVASSL